MSHVPLIGVTGRRFDPGSPFRLEAATAIQSAYLDAVTRAGGLAAVIPPQALAPSEADDWIERLDGIVLTGGVDVDPSRYGQEAVPQTYGVSEMQDAFEFGLLDAARRAAAPVLAICRGLQVVNVAFGGSLDQHITGRDGLGAHGIPNGGGGSVNEFVIEAETLLAQVVGSDRAVGHCHHHQIVDRVADGLVVSACTADGVVEGLELAEQGGQWLVAVQWHPEETAEDGGANQRLFDHLVAAALH
ncbi:MAG TPA: gamma-glutamyl-gamma-aminobutyrate hydrolase family protein [Microthrixaceae bacterium]|nr:gamma-glutamyl-gamma-aminobutyrate hydrolase family protein [Microthrixaceae bacterium]